MSVEQSSAPSGRSQIAAQVKPVMRQIVDRIALPYVDEVVRRLRPGDVDRVPPVESAAGPADGLPDCFTVSHAALHEARTLALCDVPGGARVMLSAGASGRWYFDWIEDSYGPVTRHIGVEAYLPEPTDLPDYVQWLAADIAGEDGIAVIDSGSVDLVFSGQNLEHLWPRQMVGFFTEANRVLRDGGLLVVDSPNRELTAAYRWSMGEHTIELTPDEAAELFDLAGFALDHMKGVWLCRRDGVLLPFDPDPRAEGDAGLVRRFALANERPQDSFIWWAEARRVADADVDGLSRRVAALFTANWGERVGRLRIFEGEARPWEDGRPGVVMHKGRPGYGTMGPWMPVPAGAFAFETTVAWSDCDDHDAPFAFLDVVADEAVVGEVALYPGGLRDGSVTAACPFEFDALRFAVHARLRSTGTATVTAPLSLSITPDPWRASLG